MCNKADRWEVVNGDFAVANVMLSIIMAKASKLI